MEDQTALCTKSPRSSNEHKKWQGWENTLLLRDAVHRWTDGLTS